MKIPPKVTLWLFISGSLLVFLTAAARFILLNPIFGSQEWDLINLAFFVDKSMWVLFIAGFLLFILPLFKYITYGKLKTRIISILVIIVCSASVYVVTNVMHAKKIFLEPSEIVFKSAQKNQVSEETIIIGTLASGEPKAYPIKYLSFHHKVQDTLGEKPLLVTYCIMCRSGRVFNPVVRGKYLQFKLIGANHYNAIMEDTRTGTWWWQATGEAFMGKDRGAKMEEYICEQMTLKNWLRMYPNSLIFQPDSVNIERMKYYSYLDTARPDSSYFSNDSSYWEPRSWVIGVAAGASKKAFPWGELIKQRVMNDSVGNVPVVLVMEDDSISFHVWNRKRNNHLLHFNVGDKKGKIFETTTGTYWDMNGYCLDGEFKGHFLTPLHSYQEYWKSWRVFQQGTEKWGD